MTECTFCHKKCLAFRRDKWTVDYHCLPCGRSWAVQETEYD